jgi:peptide chain release factor subunit 1
MRAGSVPADTDATHRKGLDATGIDVEYAPSVETIARIEGFRSPGPPVVSAYVTVPPGPEGRKRVRSSIDSLLHQVRPRANDRGVEHDARLSLREDIERIGDVGESGPFKAGTLAIFSCSGAGFFEVIGLPRAVRDRITVDATPATRLMLGVLDEYRRCCAVVVDRETAYAWELYLGEVLDTGALPGSALRGIGHAVNERRNDHKVEELEKRHFRQVASALDELFRTGGYDVMTVGGHGEELPRFLALLPGRLRERVIGTFAIDHHSVRPATARERTEEILHRHELEEHQRQVAEVLARAGAGGRATVGLGSCLWAGSVRGIETLYVQEGAVAPGVVCDESRWMGLSGGRCPICGRETRETPDVIDELAEAVIEESGSVHHVLPDAGLADMIAAASLRFPLPPAPDVVSAAR